MHLCKVTQFTTSEAHVPRASKPSRNVNFQETFPLIFSNFTAGKSLHHKILIFCKLMVTFWHSHRGHQREVIELTTAEMVITGLLLEVNGILILHLIW